MAIELRPKTKSNDQIIKERRERKLDLLLEIKNEKQIMNEVKNIPLPPQPPKDRIIKEGGFVEPPRSDPDYAKIMEKHNNKKWWQFWID